MCYKYLWNNLITEKFLAENFFSYFNLDSNYLLSNDVKGYISSLRFDAKVIFLTFKLFSSSL
jgi:exonuclease V